MLRFQKRITQCYIEMAVVDIVQEHIDTAEVVGGLIDFLTIETLLHIILPNDFGNLHQQ